LWRSPPSWTNFGSKSNPIVEGNKTLFSGKQRSETEISMPYNNQKCPTVR